MPKLYAWQHIYANVERNESPSKTAGFQTLFYTHDGLSEEEVADIEERVFYITGDHNPVKRICFRLGTDKLVVGQVTPVSGQDNAGRSGLYVAHCLIFRTAEFAAANINPMQLFELGVLVDTTEAALAKGDKQSSNIAEVLLDIPSAKSPAQTWDADTFRQLAQLAINHKAVADDRAAVAFIGSTEEIEAAVQHALTVVPPQILPYCSFDTFFERGGKLNITYCWGTGFSEKPRQKVYILVDAADRQVQYTGELATPITSYGRWVDAMLTQGKYDTIHANKREAFLVTNYLDNKEGDLKALDGVSESLLASLLEANKKVVAHRMLRQLSAKLPKVIATRLHPVVSANMQPIDLLDSIQDGFNTKELLQHLFAAYQESGFAAPEKAERKALAALLEEHPHQKLKSLLLIWGDGGWNLPIDKWRIKSGIKSMDAAAYAEFWKLAVPTRLVDPENLLVDGKEVLFAERAIEDKILTSKVIPDLVSALVKAKTLDPLDRLAPYLNELDEKQIKKVKRALKGINSIPPAFKETLGSLAS
ncbi:MAG: hypothetical protein AAF564_24135 [Bacteroidota bacterium]